MTLSQHSNLPKVNAWDRPRTKLRIAMGICPDCGDRDSAPGGNRCTECREKYNAQKRSKWASGEAEGTRARRIPYQRHRARLVREKLLSSGLCIQCRKPVSKFQRCNRCRKLAAEAKKRYRLKFHLNVKPQYCDGIQL